MAINILVVEDSPTQSAQLCFLLDGAGYRPCPARDGETALEMAAQEPFDLVISDVTMPGIDGYEVCRRLKENRRLDLPVILLTSLTDPMDIVRGLEAGADNYVTKPYEPDQLLARIQHVLENRALRRGAKSRMGVTVTFLGKTFTINSDREQILDLLIATFEDAVLQNRQLRQREEELQTAKAQLARYAGTLEARLQSVLQSVPEVLFSLNAAATELYYVSPACARILGFTPEEFAADPRRWQAAMHPDDQAAAVGRYEQLVHERRTGVLEYRIVPRGGAQNRWVQATIIPVTDERGTVVRVDGVISDVTERKQLEQQVRQAQKMEAVGTLAGGVAHDFNNLLAAIRATVDLALFGLDPKSEIADELRQIAEAVDRGASLTRQLLAFGRAQVLEPRPVDLSTLVGQTRKMLERIIGEDVRLAVAYDPEPATVLADPGQLEQVLMNLCVNARDAMPHGGELAIMTERVRLDQEFCALHPWAQPGDFVLLSVSDTGVGMTPETQARIFEPFFTTKEMGRGTGLGLAVVYGIVKQHGGMIHVYSEPGQGTTFRIYLPFRPVTPVAAAAEDPTPLPGGDQTILLAEDDDILRTMTTRLLERLGYTLIVVTNGKEALETLAERGDQIDLAILDVVMPEMGGPAVVERVRDRFPNLRFVFTTGYSPNTMHMAPMHNLPAAVLQKPYGVAALARAVRQALTSDRHGS